MLNSKDILQNFRNFNFSELDNNTEKWAISLFFGILFLIFSSKFFYMYLNIFTKSLGKDIITNIGCIKASGIFISAILFTITLYVIFTLFSDNYEANDNRLVISMVVGTLFFLLNLNSVYIFIERLKNKLFFIDNENVFSCEKTLFSKIISSIIFTIILRISLGFED